MRFRISSSLLARLAIGSLAATAALAAGCKSSAPKKGPPATPVRIATATRIDAPVNIIASGIVEPVQSVAVTAQVSGSLLSVEFKEGDFVQAGQVLFHIDPRPLTAAVDQVKANLARDEAQAAAGRADDERYRKLADMGYVSRSQADQMHATALAQAATVAADRAALRAAQVNLGFATIRAPIAGRTGSLLVRKGNNVSPGGSPLVVINQISPMLVRFPVLAQDFPTLQRAVAVRPLEVRAMASDSSQSTEIGHLDFLDNAIDSLTGTVTGKANFPNTGRRLWPGELVFLTVQVDVQHGVIAVPSEAVMTGQQGPYVYVVDAKNTATMRPVATGIQVADMTVLQKGLNAGERVVIDGQSRLNPGSRVAITGMGSDTATANLGNANGGMLNGDSASANGDIVAGRAGQPGAPEMGGTAGGAGAGGVSAGGARAGAVSAGAVSAGAASNGAARSTTPNLPPPIVRSPTSPTSPTSPARPPTALSAGTVSRP